MSTTLGTNRNQMALTRGAVNSAAAMLTAVLLSVPMLRAEADPVSTGTESGWGAPVEGLSVHLSAKKTLWDLPKPCRFEVSVRNQSRESFLLARTQVAGELEVDGVWYAWSNPIYVTYAPLASGARVDDITVTPTVGSWRKDLILMMAGPGKHTIRFAVLARKETTGRVIRAESNPLVVELRWPTNANNMSATLVPADLPIIADLQGRVVDDETDAPVTDFWVQAGVTSAEQLGKINWSQTFTGPWIGRPSWYGVQGRKAGQTWRVLADGYLPHMVTENPISDEKFQAFDLVVRLKRGGELRGVVLDHTGQPAAGARVYLITEQTPDFLDGSPDSTFRGSITSTDAAGRFVLRGVGTTEPKVVVVSPDGLQICPAAKPVAGKDLKITLAKPTALIVRYDIPGDETNAELSLTLWTSEMAWQAWRGIRFAMQPTVANGGQVVLTNLAPGRYEFYRNRKLMVSNRDHGAMTERRTIVLEPGQTTQVDLVRSVGHRVTGEVTGLEHINAEGGYLYVRAAIATGEPRNMMEKMVPCFDATTFGRDGKFQTALLEPGTYTMIAKVYEPEPEETQNIDGRQVIISRSGIRLPTYFGAAKVTVTADAPTPPIKIGLHR